MARYSKWQATKNGGTDAPYTHLEIMHMFTANDVPLAQRREEGISGPACVRTYARKLETLIETAWRSAGNPEGIQAGGDIAGAAGTKAGRLF